MFGIYVKLLGDIFSRCFTPVFSLKASFLSRFLVPSLTGWGDARFGQLGLENVESMGDDANEMGDDLPAVDLGLGRTGKQVSAGAWHSCALLDDDSVKCWGSGFSISVATGGEIGVSDHFRITDFWRFSQVVLFLGIPSTTPPKTNEYPLKSSGLEDYRLSF